MKTAREAYRRGEVVGHLIGPAGAATKAAHERHAACAPTKATEDPEGSAGLTFVFDGGRAVGAEEGYKRGLADGRDQAYLEPSAREHHYEECLREVRAKAASEYTVKVLVDGCLRF